MVIDFLLSHSMLLRGETYQSVKFIDFFTIPLINKGPTSYNLIILVIDNGKMNQFGRLKYNTVI